MLDLRLVGVHADGDHLLFADESGERYRVVIDQSLRDAVRRDRTRAPSGAGAEGSDTQLRPRDVQSLLRSGVSVEEVAERSGWTIEKIQRYEPPVRAERDHVALLVQDLPVHRATPDAPDSFGERAITRLLQRGVDRQDIRWDSWRTDNEWTVIAVYPAGGRLRQATWMFDPQSQSVRPTDDEARWLGEDGAEDATARRDASVFDLEANGGFDGADRRPSARRVPGSSRPVQSGQSPDDGSQDDRTGATSDRADAITAADPNAEPEDPRDKPVDLVSVMRERSKGRRRRSHRRSDSAAVTPKQAAPAEPFEAASSKDEESDPRHTAASGEDVSAEEAGLPSDEPRLDHDPVTGTKDLFASMDDDADAPAEQAHNTDDVDVTADSRDDDGPGAQPSAPGDDEATDRLDSEDLDDDTEEIVVPSRPSKARKGRPSVPSWDDIMFGANPRFED